MSNNIKAFREELGFSQQKLSEKTHIGAPDLSRVERNQGVVHPGWKRRIARALGKTIEEVFPRD